MRGLLAAGALGVGAAALWLAAPEPSAPVAAPPPAESPVAPAEGFVPPTPPAPTRLEAFRARPPFSAARRPPPPPAPEVVATPAPSGLLFDRYVVAGVVVSDGAPVALLRDAAAGTLVRLRRGDRLGEAVLVAIDLARLTFAVGDRTVTADVGSIGRNP
jgi:hypothetical protein